MRIPAPATFSRDEYRALHDGAGVFSRRERGRLLLRGADRTSYLQGLLSNDVAALPPGSSCYATLLTPQGRMISDMRVFALGDAVLIDLERAVAPAVCAHLEMFVITEDVTVEDVTSTLAQVGLYGPGAAKVLAAARATGVEVLHVLDSGDIGVEGVDLIVPAAGETAVVGALMACGALPISADTTEVTRVEAGIPRFLADMDSTTIPLEAGIEDRAISLTKGCYVGQEVIIRVLHRGGGRVARKLVSVVVDAPNVVRGDPVVAGDREVGRVTSAVDSPRHGQRLALAYVHRDFAQPGSVLSIRGAAARTL